jgi:hypothetical protein
MRLLLTAALAGSADRKATDQVVTALGLTIAMVSEAREKHDNWGPAAQI